MERHLPPVRNPRLARALQATTRGSFNTGVSHSRRDPSLAYSTAGRPPSTPSNTSTTARRHNLLPSTRIDSVDFP